MEVKMQAYQNTHTLNELRDTLQRLVFSIREDLDQERLLSSLMQIT